MNKINFVILIAFIFSSCSGLDEKQMIAGAELSGSVVKITDGDTFRLLTDDNSEIRIRMNGIDAPEKKQDYYQVSKNALGNYIFQKRVRLATTGKDRYGRVLATVFIDGQNINLAMVRDGYAWHYKKYSSDSLFANAETEAKMSNKGLWSMPNPIEPWEFRKK
jgi:micrococcal nuclease